MWIFMPLVIGLLAMMLVSIVAGVACGGDAASDQVSVARMRLGEKVDGQCIFGDDLSQYPVTYSEVSEDCWQAVGIGPLTPAELDRMKREESSFWQNSSPYRQSLVGELIDGKCDFSGPAVQAYLEFSETVSTDRTRCVMLVEVGPATEKQIDKVQRFGTTLSSTAVPATTVPVPGQR